MTTPLTDKQRTQLCMFDWMERLMASRENPVLLLGARSDGKMGIYVSMAFPHEELVALCEAIVNAVREERYVCTITRIDDSLEPGPAGEE